MDSVMNGLQGVGGILNDLIITFCWHYLENVVYQRFFLPKCLYWISSCVTRMVLKSFK